jgi:hypothetical protein
MRKVASKLHWGGRGVLVTLALAVGILGLLLVSSSVKAVPPPFNVSVTTDVTDTEHLANANIESEFNVSDDPWPAAYYQNQVSFTPSEWGVPESADIPIGAVVGTLAADATLGWFNNPCNRDLGGYLHIDFDPLLNCSIDTSDTIEWNQDLGSPYFDDTDGIPGGCDKYPDFLNEMFPGITPRTRHAGFEYIGVNVSLNFLTFEPGTNLPLPGMPSFSPDLGYVAMSVLNNPKAPLVKNQITDNCAPLTTATVYYGLTLDNPGTGANEAGYEWRTNPQYGGTYTFNGFAGSMRDADDDSIDNFLDTCPHIANEGDPRINWSGDDDKDGIDNVCDPTPDLNTNALDHDGDGFPNRQDNCPVVPNGLTEDNPAWDDQADEDFDGIGDACDQDDWNDDGDITDPGEPTGFSASTPDGDQAVVWFSTDFEISGPEPGQDTDGDGFEDAEEANLGSDPDDADSTPEHTDVAGTCTDELDNDLDGYIDDIDGGCEDDSDGDGASDEGEEDLGSDPDDADSTPEDASVAGTCDDGVDNDLDGDIDAEDDGCAVPETPTPTPEEGTPTPTPEEGTPTPTPEEGTPTPTVEVDICEPVFPGLYNGRVLKDGSPAAAGWEVTAWVGGVEWASAIVSGGRYAMDIPDRLAVDTCFEPGTITFKLDGMSCEPSPEWAAGLQDDVDLTCVSAEVTPTPEEPTPTVEPTPTPTVLPPTGMGGMSGDGSFMWWPLALAAAALTSAAGLGALVAVKRR